MTERLDSFNQHLKNLSLEERQKRLKDFEDAVNKLRPFDYEECLKILARTQGKDENHYLER